MIERGGRVRLALEAPEPLGIGRQRRGQHLDRDVAPEPRVAGAIDLAHSTRAERRDDLVGTQARSGGEAHGFFSASGQLRITWSGDSRVFSTGHRHQESRAVGGHVPVLDLRLQAKERPRSRGRPGLSRGAPPRP